MSRTRALLLAAVLVVVAGTAAALAETRGGRSVRTEIRSLIATGYPLYCGGGTRPYVEGERAQWEWIRKLHR